MNRLDFGQFVRQARIKAGLTLREAARRMGYSASFVSRVEAGDEPASAKLISAMAHEYGVKIEEFTKRATDKASGVYGNSLRSSPELRALYRLGTVLTPQEIETVLRTFLKERYHLDGEELEAELRKLRAELPRLRSGGEGLFAADVTPRRLTERRITTMADRFLQRHGLTLGAYTPPTPLEALVDAEPDIRSPAMNRTCSA
jgi:transcriptional regulator with XRE-family HTH domain